MFDAMDVDGIFDQWAWGGVGSAELEFGKERKVSVLIFLHVLVEKISFGALKLS